MTDDLDVLRRDRDVVEPDPQFRAELMDRLRHDMTSGPDLAPAPLTLSAVTSVSAPHEQRSTVVAGADTASRRPRRPGRRWFVAMAAAIVFLALAAAVTLLDDDQSVDTVPPATDAPLPRPGPEPPEESPELSPPALLPRTRVQALPGRTIASGSGCPFGISGDPVDLQPGLASDRFGVEAGQGVAYLVFGEQTAEVRVPWYDLQDEEPWRMEPIELGGRSAKVWLDGPESTSHSGGSLPFVQVRVPPDPDEPCSSFMVTVDGGTEETNRQIAVDLAERVLLPADLEDLDLPGAEGGPVAGLELAGTTWRVTPPGHPASGATMTFTDTTVRWTDGCATLTADYELDREDGILVLSNTTSTDPGCTPPTNPEVPLGWSTITSVMSSERIDVGLIGGEVYLGDYPSGEYHLQLGSSASP